MKKFFKNKGVLILIAVVFILSVIIGVVNAANPNVTFVENVVQVVVTPIQKLITNMGNGVSGFFGYFSDVDKLHKEIESLKSEKAKLEIDLAKSETSSIENEELRKLLSLKDAYPELEFAAAQIIAREPSNWYNTFTIDKGVADGVAINQPIVSSDKTLIGRISEVGTTWARVTTLSDPGHSAGAVVVRSGEYGIIDGDTSFEGDENFKLAFISKNADIIVGDRVVTSGLGGIYPKGLNIGKVLEIRPDIQGISQYAVVAPDADIENLRFVLVVLNPTDEF